MSGSGLISILFTDLVGSTELISDIGDVAADNLRRAQFTDLREAMAATGGTEVKTIGDAEMAASPSRSEPRSPTSGWPSQSRPATLGTSTTPSWARSASSAASATRTLPCSSCPPTTNWSIGCA